jgi:putative tryptophan/tyrosine transport system substrate-binding protein
MFGLSPIRAAEIYSMIRRREFFVGLGGAAVWPLAARAQQGERVRRVGFLTYGSEIVWQKTLRDELEKLGWTEGRNLRLDSRFGNGDATKTRDFAADLVQLAPDVIVAVYGASFRQVQQRTKTIPIVIIGGGDLLENGQVKNLSHPEGNATGFPNIFGSLGGKWMQLLKEVAPNVMRVGSIYPAGSVTPVIGSLEAAAQSLGVRVVRIPVSDAASLKAAIEAFAAEPNGGLIPSPAARAIVPPDELSRLALQYHLPTVCGVPGVLVNYFPDLGEMIHGAATYVDRLLRGAKVSDLPVQYPTKFRLTVNLKMAKALSLEVPLSVLARADEVIE